MKYLLFSDQAVGFTGNVYSFDLESEKVDTVLSPLSQTEGVVPDFSEGWVGEGVCRFSFAPNGDLYFIWFPLGPAPCCICMAPVETNTYPTDMGHLQFSDIYDAPTGNNYLSAVRVRQVNSSQRRIYFSIGYSDQKDGQIYYLIEKGGAPKDRTWYNAIPYYTVKLDQIPCKDKDTGKFTNQCWLGDFAFDDENTLYLSNGSVQGSCVYRVTDAGLDGGVGLDKDTGRHDLFGNPQRIFNLRPADDVCLMGVGGGIKGLQYVKGSPNALYFVAQNAIMKLDLDTNESSQVLLCSQTPTPPLGDLSYLESSKPMSAVLPGGAAKIGQKGVHKEAVYARAPQVTGATRGPPSPEPNLLVAQEWVKHMLKKRGINTPTSPYSHYALYTPPYILSGPARLREGKTIDEVSGIVMDQYCKFHRYTVLISKDGKIQPDVSTIT